MAIKILIGGSPCTYWSIAQKNNRETEASGMGWELFKNYLIALEKFKPDFFLYENNKSAAQAIKDQIAREFGVGVDPAVRFTYINSALVSAQNRQRFYVTNFGDIAQPEDRGILLRDILETGNGFSTCGENAFALTATYGKGGSPDRLLEKHQRTAVAEQVPVKNTNVEHLLRPYGSSAKIVSPETDKAPTLLAAMGAGGGNGIYHAEPVGTTSDGKSYCMTAGYSNGSGENIGNYAAHTLEKGCKSMVAEPIQIGALPRPHGELSTSQAMRIYSSDGKSVTQSAGGGGLCGKTGLYAIPVDNQRCATPCEWDDNGIPLKAISCADGKTYTVYEVKDGQITIKGKQYPIKLDDGYYIIRKLTVRECARLQTMPDDYCKAVSDSQAYKALGNGWTAEVIIHLLNHALKDVPRDEEIVVLSLYDGIATGRYCLDKMGFTNVTYHAYEIDKYPIQVAMDNYPDIIQHGDAFAVREDDWKPPQTRSEWLDELLGL